MLMPRFATWWQGHNCRGETFVNDDYIVDNRGFEPLPQLINRLCRGEIVPRKPVSYDGTDDELENLDDVPEVDDFVDVDAVAEEVSLRLKPEQNAEVNEESAKPTTENEGA